MSILFIALFAAGAFLVEGQTPAAAPSAFAYEVIVEPDTTTPKAYLCRPVIKDLETGEVISAGTVRFLRGEDANMTTEWPGGLTVQVVVSVDDDGSRALFASEILRGEEKVHAQSLAIEL